MLTSVLAPAPLTRGPEHSPEVTVNNIELLAANTSKKPDKSKMRSHGSLLTMLCWYFANFVVISDVFCLCSIFVYVLHFEGSLSQHTCFGDCLNKSHRSAKSVLYCYRGYNGDVIHQRSSRVLLL